MPQLKISKQVKYYRNQTGLSQEKLARILNVSTQTIRNWEMGVTEPRVGKYEALRRFAEQQSKKRG